jgi:NADH:ubiquinone oxidoreductase subunit D
MGAESGRLRISGRQLRLSRRHTELVWLLASAPHGLSGQALDVALHLDGEHLVTIRAEINRLRRVLGDDLVDSRPYRLRVSIMTDVDVVRRQLAEGRVALALAEFKGSPLPGSDAPRIRSMSEEFTSELRQAVLDSGSATALEHWTALPEGHDDVGAWRALAAIAPSGSPRRALGRAHLRRLG